MRRTCSRVLVLASSLASLLATSGAVPATVGLAEWSVRTPGGAVISHADGWKERHGDCLRSPDGDRVYVSWLQRWRYHEGFVSGETTAAYFLFDERTTRVERFDTERALDAALSRRGAGRPLSGWLTAADGWAESYFFELVWIPCRIRDDGPLDEREAAMARAVAAIAPADCGTALDEKRLALHARTTWGRRCDDPALSRRLERESPARARRFRQLCEALGDLRPVEP